MKKGVPLIKLAAWIDASAKETAVAFGACVDSRLVKPGDLFFACAGERCDGHTFLCQAAQKGAVAAVVSQAYGGEAFGLPLIRVDHPEKALQRLAKKFLAAAAPKVVAITGSMGKTTTKEFLGHLLASTYRVASTPGNYNSQLGMPLTILNQLSGDEDVIVLEMGMTMRGHIAALVEIAPPEIAVITGVALAHAENFDSLEAIALAKAEILSHPNTKVGIVDHRIGNYQQIASVSRCPLRSFAYGDDQADYTLISDGEGLLLMEDGAYRLHFEPLALPGEHNLHNFLAAAVAAKHCGVKWEAIREAAKTLSLPAQRLQIEEWQGITFVNDAYNALPIAVKAALDSLPLPKPGGRKIAVLSEMRELGAFSEQCHREVAKYALSRVDRLFCLGKECAPMHAIWSAMGRPIYWASELSELAEQLRSCIQTGDVILIKGSRTSGFSTLLEEGGLLKVK